MSNILDFYSYNKKENNINSNNFKIWHQKPIVQGNEPFCTILVKECQIINNEKTWKYSIPTSSEIINFNKCSNVICEWAYISDIEKLIIDFENPTIS